jgi:5-formyltetrahydrofolate cyclo-ligase
MPALKPAQRIALYWPAGAELDTGKLIGALQARGCFVYLPRIESLRHSRMRFIAFGRARLRRNRWGLLEPTGHDACAARFFHWILLPLTAFDSAGNRLGSGAGFYDRALAFRRHRKSWRGPRLLGLAFEAQSVEHIATHAHDIRLDGIVTERGYRECRG